MCGYTRKPTVLLIHNPETHHNIHLKTVNNVKQYVQPLNPVDNRYAFGLSQENAKGHSFGGVSTNYRLRVFRVNSAHASLPADWRDVVNLYRNWVLVRRQSQFYAKTWNHPDGPIDNLSPHTIISNYGLDGPIAASLQDPDLPGARLEIHPPKLGNPPNNTDMPNNKNVSVQDALVRIRDRVNTSAKEVKLEAQLWGFEMGGIYHYYGGYPPITNVLKNEPQRFQQVMAQLFAASIFPSITTDPLIPLVNRGRYRGHLRWNGGNSTEFGNPLRYAPFFRGGRMLGRTNVKLSPPGPHEPAPPPTVQAWTTGLRTFTDVVPFGGTPLQGTIDFLSLGIDKDEFAGLVTSERLPHMIWRKQWGANDVRYIYAFANVGNTPLKFQFQYTRGLDTSARWGKIIRVFDDRNTNGCEPTGGAPATTPVEAIPGNWETALDRFPLAARSFAVVGLLKF